MSAVDERAERVAGALCQVRDEREHYPFAVQPCRYCIDLARDLLAALDADDDKGLEGFNARYLHPERTADA